jgi:hypothetical protein
VADPFGSTVDRNGFSLNVAVACQGQQRERLERLCRYVTRPAVCLERLSINAAGQVSYELKHPFRDGTTHILFTPEDFANPSRNKSKKPTIQPSTETAVDQPLHCAPLSWAERLKRVFDIDISVCPLCGGTLS